MLMDFLVNNWAILALMGVILGTLTVMELTGDLR